MSDETLRNVVTLRPIEPEIDHRMITRIKNLLAQAEAGEIVGLTAVVDVDDKKPIILGLGRVHTIHMLGGVTWLQHNIATMIDDNSEIIE